jgi:hypothetical protein
MRKDGWKRRDDREDGTGRIVEHPSGCLRDLEKRKKRDKKGTGRNPRHGIPSCFSFPNHYAAASYIPAVVTMTTWISSMARRT